MKLSAETPRRARAVQSAIYADAGLENFSFQMPRPFTAEMCEALADQVGASAEGLANTLNQVLAENLGNNMASRIKTIAANNEALKAAQANGERTDEEFEPLPSQEDLDSLAAVYDFSGVRASSSEAEAVDPVTKTMWKMGRELMRGILKQYGIGDMEAPVTVARGDKSPGPNQISLDDFNALVAAFVDGEGPWSTSEPHVAKRAQILELARAQAASVNAESMRIGQAA